MKKSLMSVAVAAIALALLSCGGQSKDSKTEPKTTLTPSKTEVKGPLSEYYTVVDQSYDFAEMDRGYFGDDLIISIELQRTDKPFPEKYLKGYEPAGTYGYSVKGNYGIGIKIKDADGKQVFSARADEGGLDGPYSSDDLKDLWELEAGETNQVRWNVEELKDPSGEYTFEITSYLD